MSKYKLLYLNSILTKIKFAKSKETSNGAGRDNFNAAQISIEISRCAISRKISKIKENIKPKPEDSHC